MQRTNFPGNQTFSTHDPVSRNQFSPNGAASSVRVSGVLSSCVVFPGGTVYQPVTVVTPQGQVVTQALSPGTIRVQNNQVGHPSV